MQNSPSVRYGQPNFELLAAKAALPATEDAPFFMVNLMKYRAVADYGDAAAPARTGREADDEYAPLDILAEIGARVVFAADVERQLLGDETQWDRVGVVEYPSWAAFFAMQQRPDFQSRHVHKNAGMEQLIVLTCSRLQLPKLPPAAPRELAPGDRPFVMMHLLKFAEGGQAEMANYSATSGAKGLEMGVRPHAYFTVEGTVVGDGRAWDQVRFNAFPSHETFDHLRSDATHQAGQAGRAAALSSTYTLMLLPKIDHFGEA